jgi:hypothetical protein
MNDELKEPLRQEPSDPYAQLRTAMEVIVVLILLGVALVVLFLHRDSMTFPQRLVAFAGAICTLAILTVLYKENAIYRLFEHIFIGLGAGYGVVITWREVLEPEWWTPLKAGGWYWLIPMFIAMLYYTVYSKKFSWMSRLLVSTLFGIAAGQAFQGFAAQVLPQVSKSFKPLWGTGITPGDSFNNFIFVATLVCVLVYFFFSFRQEKPAVRGVATSGRWLMMIAFGAVFGSTVMGRFSLFIGRAQFLLNDWLGVPRQ